MASSSRVMPGRPVGSGVAAFHAILDACDLALNHPSETQKHSSAVVREDGRVVFRLAVTGQPPYKVFWSLDAGTPRFEAVFPHP